MSKETEEGGYPGEGEGDDMKDQAVGQPFDYYLRYIEGQVIADEGVDV